MAERYLYRGADLAPNSANSGKANTVRVDSDDDLLKWGTGTSGTTEKTAVDLSAAQTLTNKTLTAPVITNPTLSGTTPISVTGATVTLGATHVGRTAVINSASGCAITLPAATGTGNKYRVVVGTTLTSGSLSAAVASGTDYLRGFALFANDTDGSASNFETANTGTVATESDTITLNRTTTGIGTIGDSLDFEDVATAVWVVHVKAQASGTEATPFSAAV